MSDLVVIAFDEENKAFELQEALAEMHEEHLIEMDEVSVVSKDEKGKINIHHYGDFGVDDNYENWNLRGLAGYRFSGWGVGWNIQAGYRSMRLMGLEKSAADLKIDIHGPVALFTVEF